MTYPDQQPSHDLPGSPDVSAQPDPFTPAPLPLDSPTPDRKGPATRTLLFIGGCAVVLVAATIATTVALTTGGTASKSNTIEVNGRLTLTGRSTMSNGSCLGDGGYDDIHGGAQVTVTDQADTVVGIGALANGSRIDGGCEFLFIVKSIPAGKSFYGVAVSHRGTIRFTEAQMKDRVALTLGS
jgi:hypothetical protein